ncbi:hypothetical protein EV401DRAFT_1833053, partial [Pisolithus croceorrhizus]
LGQNSVLLPVVIQTLDDQHSFQLDALLDSGASGCYIDKGFAWAKSLNLSSLPHLVPVYNADGSPNNITSLFPIILRSPLIMGFDWLCNPSIDWQSGKVTFDSCPPSC